jgi:t-SNARE complex subunit (syntaxin)
MYLVTQFIFGSGIVLIVICILVAVLFNNLIHRKYDN